MDSVLNTGTLLPLSGQELQQVADLIKHKPKNDKKRESCFYLILTNSLNKIIFSNFMFLCGFKSVQQASGALLILESLAIEISETKLKLPVNPNHKFYI